MCVCVCFFCFYLEGSAELAIIIVFLTTTDQLKFRVFILPNWFHY